jgi:OOP family OmpA-OmpF porin
MRTIFKAFTAFVMLGALAGMAQADEGDNYSFVLGSSLEPDTAFNQDNGLGLQAGFGREMNEALNIEGYLRFTSAKGSPAYDNSAIGADLQLIFFRELKFEPYVFIGMDAQRSHLGGLGADNGTAQNFGAGFRANVFNNDRMSLRGEYRYISYDAHKLNLDDQLYSLGFQFAFGKKSPPPVVAVPPPPPAPKPAPRDSDGDGVIDDNDKCPGTVRGAAVDATGCELDGDNDGVVNRLDKCPNTRAGAQVDVNGCEIKEEIQLQGVTFETNSDRLVGGTESVLNEAAATLIKNPSIKVEVAGHTDSDGAAEYNESLSARRAATVRDYLAARGVEMSRMTMRGYGESQPVADNATREGKAANRRVVLRITAR